MQTVTKDPIKMNFSVAKAANNLSEEGLVVGAFERLTFFLPVYMHILKSLSDIAIAMLRRQSINITFSRLVELHNNPFNKLIFQALRYYSSEQVLP